MVFVKGDIQVERQRSVNEILLRAGLAWHFKKYDKFPYFSQLEDDARAAHKGIWSMQPIEPWEFRKSRNK